MRRLVASGLGVGLIPRLLLRTDNGAGTFGAALGAGIAVALAQIGWGAVLAGAVAAIGLSLWASAPFALDGEDPGWVVIDEVAGTMVALVGLSGLPWLAALVVARVGDITKWLPGVRAAERLHGAVGVTLDDVVAGLYGLAVGWALSGVGA